MRLLFSAASLMALVSLGTACSASEPPMLKLCEQVLKKRLKSPSGYQRISFTQDDQSLSMAEYLVSFDELYGVPANKLRKQQAASGAPTLFRIIIEYDAPNDLGVPVRGVSICDTVDSVAEFRQTSDFYIRIDDLTTAQWLIEGLKQ